MEEIPDISKTQTSDVENSDSMDPQSRMIPLSEVLAGYAKNNPSNSPPLAKSQLSIWSTNRKAVLSGVVLGLIAGFVAILAL